MDCGVTGWKREEKFRPNSERRGVWPQRSGSQEVVRLSLSTFPALCSASSAPPRFVFLFSRLGGAVASRRHGRRERQAPAWRVCGFSPTWGSAFPGGGLCSHCVLRSSAGRGGCKPPPRAPGAPSPSLACLRILAELGLGVPGRRPLLPLRSPQFGWAGRLQTAATVSGGASALLRRHHRNLEAGEESAGCG